MVDEMERISDESELASDLEEQLRVEGIQKVLSRSKPPPDFDGIHCTECGEVIPPERLATGAHTDIDCQRAIEIKKRNHRSYYE